MKIKADAQPNTPLCHPRPDVERQGYAYEAACGGSSRTAGFVRVTWKFTSVRRMSFTQVRVGKKHD
jgi:hypothetical protein